MLSRIYLLIFIVAIFGASFLYFSSNSSYKNSLQARVYYFLGNYEKALLYATEAYEMDKYNKMAFTVLTQSKIAKNYENYIKQGNEYLIKIDKISAKSQFLPEDRIRVKIMCEVMMETYKDLVPTALTDKKLRKNSEVVYLKFKQLFEELY